MTKREEPQVTDFQDLTQKLEDLEANLRKARELADRNTKDLRNLKRSVKRSAKGKS